MEHIYRQRTPQRPRKVLRWGEYLLLTIGFICLGWVGYSYAATYLFQSYETYTLGEMLKGRQPSMSGYLGAVMSGRGDDTDTQTAQSKPDVDSDADADTAEKPHGAPAKIARPVNGLLGRVEVPRLGISAIVREGVDLRTLKHAVGHVPETAFPGQPGNVAIAAHRDTFFRNLRGVKKGDIIQLVTPSGTFEYQVETTKIVWPTNVEVLRPTPEPAITLVTCYPFNYIGSAPKRFIVRGRQITTEAKADAQKGS